MPKKYEIKFMKIGQLFHKVTTGNKDLYKTVMWVSKDSKARRLIYQNSNVNENTMHDSTNNMK